MSTASQFPSAAALCERSLVMMVDAALAEFEQVFHPEATNRESRAEPLVCRGRGPAAFHGSALWLRSAYDDLGWQIHDTVTEGDVVAVHTTMTGRHTRPFVVYGEEAQPVQAFPPTGKEFAVTQSHWFRVGDGLIREHWANRDDLGQAFQLGWIPPSPVYLARMALALRRARREHRAAG